MMKRKGYEYIAMAIKCRPTNNQAFTLLELMLVVTIIGIMAATALPLFTNYAARSKTSEALLGLSKMAQGEMAYYGRTGNFIEAGPSNIPPSSARVQINFNLDPGWQSLTFGFDGPVQFGYQAVSTATNSVDCEAIGDIDGDTVTSTFRRTVFSDGQNATLGGLQIFDELE